MKLKILKTKIIDPTDAMRHVGYGMLQDRRTGKTSFAKRIHGDLYPRFHMYVEDEGEFWSFNLHLDQKAPVYAGVTAHAGDYDGPAVEKEMARLAGLLNI